MDKLQNRKRGKAGSAPSSSVRIPSVLRSIMNLRSASLSLLIFILSAASLISGQIKPRFEFPADTVMMDEKITIIISGLQPGQDVTILQTETIGRWRGTSYATFRADDKGRVNLATMAPLSGTYLGVDAMGMFWSSMKDTTYKPDSSVSLIIPKIWRAEFVA